MNKNKLHLLTFAIALSLFLIWGGLALASEITGNLTTGLGNTVEGIVIVAPTVSPVAGTYNSTQSVTLTANGSLSIHYTTDGSTPTCSTGIVYSGAISVSSSQVITAISCYQDNYSSSVAIFGYAIVPVSTSVSTGGGGGGGGTAPVTTTLAVGNIKGSGVVNEYDFAILMADWGQTGSSKADLNNDGVVNEYDFAFLMLNWGL